MTKAGWIMTAILLLFLLPASVAPKFIGAAAAVDALAEIDWPTRYLFLLGVIELACLVLFVVPRTGLLGAVLMTGLLGGAIASHLRAGSPLLTHTLFGVYVGVFLWAALWLRDERLRALFPWQRSPAVERRAGIELV
ncbi:MAG TPA: DoxX family protein [Gammaproteobacteria bacterium]